MWSSSAIRLAVGTLTWSSQSSGFVRLGHTSGVGGSQVATGDSTAAAGDLAAQLKTQLEQDPDYQILRKFFALDRQGHWSSHVSAGRASGWQGRLMQASYSASSTSVSLSESSHSAVQLDLSFGRAHAPQLQGAAAGVERSRLAAQFTSMQSSSSVRLDLALGTTRPVQTADPLILDLAGTGVTTTGVADGVSFDLDGDGRREQVSFATGGSWMLALDRNDNGRIDDGRELFGDQNGAAHGFAELARYDDNADGVIDASDEVYAKLQLLQVDSASEQVSRSLAEADVTAIELGYQNVRKAIDLYDSVAQSGRFRRGDGTTGEAADVLLGYQDQA